MNNFTIMNLNKGDSLLPNRVPHINNLIYLYKPTIFSINKLNLQNNDSVTPQAFPDYVLEFDNLINTDLMSRTGMLVHP